MTAPRGYAIARLEGVELGPEIAEYIGRIEETMTPFGGRFLVHGGRLVPVEGAWGGDLVMLEFPDLARAEEWYRSPGYQAILPLRTGHAASTVVLVEGVSDGHHASDKLARLFSGWRPALRALSRARRGRRPPIRRARPDTAPGGRGAVGRSGSRPTAPCPRRPT
ncbi:DUF1330 domain-containing protein [Streptomyces sp. AM 2-1-1]|uniref:DUF1330 domain-containing protein n=1 Tax=Streptomyces sp. AM 2-1-1 TaxID=3028709 RepID=UPI0031BA5103